MAKTENITQQRVRELLDYDPLTGVLTWKIARPGVMAGQIAGCPSTYGYIVVRIDGVLYRANRIAFLHAHGYLPHMVDHENLVRDDNRLSNLRPATRSQNAANSGMSVRNTSGHKGVYRDKKNGKWRAMIGVDGKRLAIGRFNDIMEAARAYRDAAVANFGEFARVA